MNVGIPTTDVVKVLVTIDSRLVSACLTKATSKTVAASTSSKCVVGKRGRGEGEGCERRATFVVKSPKARHEGRYIVGWMRGKERGYIRPNPYTYFQKLPFNLAK